MARLLFEKTGNAVWISHLDLMRLFQRAFKRAGLPLTHTQGYNPRPSVSIALPLSVGVSSHCELLDFDLDCLNVSVEAIKGQLNDALIDGVNVLKVYTDGRKIRDLSLLRSMITLEYDGGVPAGAVSALQTLFTSQSLIVPKKTKNGVQDQDVAPMIRELTVSQMNANEIGIELLACCQNPTLNPMQLVAAINLYAEEFVPDFAKCCRLEVYDAQKTVFR